MKLEGDGLSIGGPAGGSRSSVQGSKFGAVETVVVAGPDLHGAQAVGFKRDFLSVRRKAGPRFSALGCNGDGSGCRRASAMVHRNAPYVVFSDRLLVGELVALACNRRRICHQAHSGDQAGCSSA